MNYKQREFLTLSFSNEGLDRGAVEETFYPWDKTIANWETQGLTPGFLEKVHFATLPTDNLYAHNGPIQPWENYYNTMMTEPVFEHEQKFGLDPVKRICFRIPFLSFEEQLLEETDTYIIRRDRDGWTRKYPKQEGLVEDIRPVVTDEEDWLRVKEHVQEQIQLHLTPEHLHAAFDPYREGSARGDFAVRLRLQGFFWCPRDLFGIEDHLMAYYDYPDLLKDISRFQLDVYKQQLEQILEILTPSLVFFEEDLSGKNGPMISPAIFDEFVGSCYQEIIPFLKEHGVANVFMDTDGDFTLLVPNILKCGLDGLLPVDVNAGVDIVEVRKSFPTLKFLGGFDKLAIVAGKDAIDAELKRLEPVIRQGGCMISTDHQPAPHTPLENYRYYVKRLQEVMREWRGEKALSSL